MARSGAVTRRIVLWSAFVAFCAIGMTYLPLADMKIPIISRVTYYQVLILAAAVLGVPALVRAAGDRSPSASRTLCRILIAYFAFELLVVIPVAVYPGRATLTAIVGAMVVRATWLLLPALLSVFADDRGRRAAGAIAVIAAACLALWGVYSALTGGAGYYFDGGELRYRVLYGATTLLFVWPFVLAASRAVTGRLAVLCIGISLVGLTLTNHRSGLIAFAIAGVVCVAMAGNLKRLVPWAVPAVLLAAVGAILWGGKASSIFGYTLSRLLDFGSGNGADRLMRWRLAWEFLVSRPLNDYVWSWRYYLINVQGVLIAHNFVLEIGVTEGVAGLAFYGSVLVTALRKAWRWGRRDAEARALLGYLIAYLVFAFANAVWYEPVNLALLVAAVGALVVRVDALRTVEAADSATVPAIAEGGGAA